jgi:hypothetical protein
VPGEIGLQDAPERFLGRAGRRAVIIRQVEMGNAEIEGAADHRPRGFLG